MVVGIAGVISHDIQVVLGIRNNSGRAYTDRMILKLTLSFQNPSTRLSTESALKRWELGNSEDKPHLWAK